MKTIIQAFDWYISKEDKHWETLAKEAVLYQELGFTDVWLPPAYKAKNGDEDAGYGVYDLYDMGEFMQKGTIATKYGNEAEYRSLIQTIQELGIGVLADIVLNHKLGADAVECVLAQRVNPNQRHEYYETQEIAAWTQFNFSGRNDVYSDFKWNAKHFTSVDFDQNQNTKALFKFLNKNWAENIDQELGNYDYLMGADVDFNEPEVIEEYIRWGEWYLDKYNFSGLRLDAVKHIQFDFFPQWLNAMRMKRNLLVIGEYWSSDVRALSNYLMEAEYAMMLFDVPLHFNLYDASQQGEHYDLRTVFTNTLTQNQPEFAIPFVDNHDTQEGQSLQSRVASWFRQSAYALILLREQGIPCVFRPDLKDPKIQILMKLRPLVRGLRSDYFDEANCIGWSFNHETGLVVLLSNHETYLKKIFVGVHHAGKIFKDCLKNCEQSVLIDAKGIGMFQVNAKTASVYTLEGRYHESIL